MFTCLYSYHKASMMLSITANFDQYKLYSFLTIVSLFVKMYYNNTDFGFIVTFKLRTILRNCLFFVIISLFLHTS